MAEISLRPSSYNAGASRTDELIGSDVFVARSATPIIPQPNPHFVFPMQAAPPTVPDSATSLPAEADATSPRRPTTRSRPQRIAVNQMPAFEFHPSSADSTSSHSVSPTRSPNKTMAGSSRTSTHRRNGSEFIGGDHTAGGPHLLSTSPTKSGGPLQSPLSARYGPPSGRRGHAHRRSGAISNHDLSTIIKPLGEPNGARSGSAPTTPSDPSGQRQFLPPLDRAASQPALQTSVSTPLDPNSNEREQTSPAGQARPRVGFSDTVEFIPRPLSTISSETSSSLSTIRPSHSVTGSITSIVSGGTSSPPSTIKGRVIPEMSANSYASEKRPRTAGPVLDSSHTGSPIDHSTILPKRPWSSNAFPRFPMIEQPQNFANIRCGPFEDRGEKDTELQVASSVYDTTSDYFHLGRGNSSTIATSPLTRPRSSPEAKIAKRQRKVKSWADSILSRKGKQAAPVDGAPIDFPLAPALRSPAPPQDFSLDDVNFDEDTTCVIRNPELSTFMEHGNAFSNWKPQDLYSSVIVDPGSPILDLDAALSSPTYCSSSPDRSSSGFLSAKRRMHSGGSTGGFTGPGMHYHRRAESAPEMAPVDYHTFGLPRFGSNPTMADVFEEDEEEELAVNDLHEASETESRMPNEEELFGLGVQIVDVAEGHTNDMIPNSENSPIRQASALRDPVCPIKSSGETILQETLAVDIVNANEEPRFSMVTKSSDDSTITPTLSLCQESLSHEPLQNIGLPSPRPGHRFDTSASTSSVSSPDFASTSFDMPRLNTAASSMTDRTVWSSTRIGEMERVPTYSAEDVPSLTSSASTMLSTHPAPVSSSEEPRSSGGRSLSLTGALPARTTTSNASKRASLVSLSRLVGGSYGEKSKLSIESRAQQDDSDKPEKKKIHRISRLMRFWKSKDKLVDS